MLSGFGALWCSAFGALAAWAGAGLLSGLSVFACSAAAGALGSGFAIFSRSAAGCDAAEGLASAGRAVACSDFAGLEAFGSDFASDLGSGFTSFRAALSWAAVLGSVGRAAACSDFAGVEAFGSAPNCFAAAFSCAVALGSAGRAAACSAACSDFVGLAEALVSDFGSAFAAPSWAPGAGALSGRADLACSVAEGLAPAEGLASDLPAFSFFAFPRFAAVLV